jgi:uncharacterized protein (DUF1330 family)
MPKAYIVFSYHSITDPQKFAAYAKLAPSAVAPFGSPFSLAAPLRWPTSRE